MAVKSASKVLNQVCQNIWLVSPAIYILYLFETGSSWHDLTRPFLSGSGDVIIWGDGPGPMIMPGRCFQLGLKALWPRSWGSAKVHGRLAHEAIGKLKGAPMGLCKVSCDILKCHSSLPARHTVFGLQPAALEQFPAILQGCSTGGFLL